MFSGTRSNGKHGKHRNTTSSEEVGLKESLRGQKGKQAGSKTWLLWEIAHWTVIGQSEILRCIENLKKSCRKK